MIYVMSQRRGPWQYVSQSKGRMHTKAKVMSASRVQNKTHTKKRERKKNAVISMTLQGQGNHISS